MQGLDNLVASEKASLTFIKSSVEYLAVFAISSRTWTLVQNIFPSGDRNMFFFLPSSPSSFSFHPWGNVELSNQLVTLITEPPITGTD